VAILTSAGVHAALLLCLHSRSASTVATIERDVEVVVDIRFDEREAEVGKTSVSPIDVGASRPRAVHRGPRPSASPAPPFTPHAAGVDEQPAPLVVEGPGALAMRLRRGEGTEEKPASSEAPPPERSITSAMGRVASAMAEPDGQKADKTSSQERVDRWTREASGEANARAGDVPPAWHDVEMRIRDSFHPPRSALTRASTVAALGGQLLNTGTARAPTDETVRRIEPVSREASLAADVRAGQEAAGRPAAWTRAEILVEVGPDGLLRRAEITASSGEASFDKLATETVRAAIAERPILDGCRRTSPCTTRIRWAVEAALRVETPPVTVPSDPRTGGADTRITPLALRFSFDETRGKIQHHRAFASEVRTRVKLLSID
jgi:hypothetical protein